MILKLKLQNWLCHENSEINFAPGMTLLYGHNGAGKTSILNGIYFTFLGKSIVKGGKIKDLVKHGANKAKVELTFFRRGNPEYLYQVERTIDSDGSQKAKLFRYIQDGEKELESDGPRNVTNRILEMFGAEPGFSKTLFLFSEGEVGQYLANSPSQRKNRFHDLLELDKVEKIRKKINKRLNVEKQELKYEIKERDNNLQRLHKLDQTEINSQIQEKKNLQNELESLEKELNNFQLEKIPPEEERIYLLLDKLENRLSDTIDLYEQESRREKMILGKYDTYSKLAEINSSRSDLNLEVKKLEYNLLQLEKEKMKIITEKEYFDSRRELLLTISDTEIHICPTCEQNISLKHMERILNDISEKIPNLQKSINKISDELFYESKVLEKKKNELQDALIAEEKIPQVKEIIEIKTKLQNEIKRLEIEKKSYLHRLNEIREQYGIKEKNSNYPILQRINEIKNLLKEINKKIDRRKIDQEQVDDIRINLKELDLEIACHEKKVILLEPVSIACKKIIDRYLQSLLKEIKDIFLSILNRLMNFPIKDLKFDEEKFLISLETETGTRDIRYLSGGEKILTYLVFRLALAKYYSHGDFFLFDEPSEHLDSYHAGIMREELFQIIRSGIFPLKQVIIAANDSRFTGPIAEEFDYQWDTIYHIEKEEHTSKVIKLKRSVQTLSTKEMINKTLSTFIDTSSVPPEIIENVRKNLNEGKTIDDKLILGLNTELMFKRLLEEYGINYIEIEETPEYGIDLIINLKGEIYGIQIKSTGQPIKNYKPLIKSELDLLKSIPVLGIKKIIIAIYFFKEMKWMGLIITQGNLDNIDKQSGKSIILKPFKEIIYDVL